MNKEFDDLFAFACAVWLLGRTQPDMFLQAVACVIRTRSLEARAWRTQSGRPHPLFGDGTLRQAGKSLLRDLTVLSWGIEDVDEIDRPQADNPGFRRALAVSCRVLNRDLPDPTGGALYCHHHTENPPWAAGAEPVALIGPLFFYQANRRPASAQAYAACL